MWKKYIREKRTPKCVVSKTKNHLKEGKFRNIALFWPKISVRKRASKKEYFDYNFANIDAIFKNPLTPSRTSIFHTNGVLRIKIPKKLLDIRKNSEYSEICLANR